MVIVDFSVLFARTDLTTALPLSFRRRPSLQPVDDIQIVDVLFIYVIAAKPVEVVPIPHLVFHFGLTVLPRSDPGAVTVPVGSCGHDATDRSVLQALDGFNVDWFVMPLQAATPSKAFSNDYYLFKYHIIRFIPIEGYTDISGLHSKKY